MVMYQIPGFGRVQLELEGVEGTNMFVVRLRLPPDPRFTYGPPGYPLQDLGFVELEPWTADKAGSWDPKYRARLPSGEVLPFRENREQAIADLMRAAGIDPRR